MIQYKEANIIRLTTEKPSKIGTIGNSGLLLFDDKKNGFSGIDFSHLYVTNNSSIHIDNYVIFENKLWRVIDISNNIITCEFSNGNQISIHKDNLLNIIASTDSKLNIRTDKFDDGTTLRKQMVTISLPKIPIDFIHEYVESNGTIDKILVEYEFIPFSIDAPNRERDSKIKVNSNSEISIKSIT